ncbi:putative serine/threonine-protein kinase PBL7 [Cinnamomum micranthum f. kanehirae]|uniref:Putative serine/threonine-protein kinase PBL7 n=1 Tax=Cinnamomum micranthum f. kanehirae TaxID=337451 RepID=A0A3S3PZT6_9MAGN|nr:putative serine/threonine-protein kinase PBL7 [Cinnamomum micranthum f. kanehirae]
MGTRSKVSPAWPPSPTHGSSTHHHHLHHTYHHHGINSTDSIIIIIITIISILLVVVGLILFLLLRRIKSTKNSANTTGTNAATQGRKLSQLNTTAALRAAYSSPEMKSCLYSGNVCGESSAKFRGGQVFTYKELEVATNIFSERNVIDNGGSGKVYRGTLSDGTVAAIKVLNRGGKQGERGFRAEVDLMSRLQCPYMVELLGYCADQNHRLLVVECMANGNLQHHLHPSSSPKKYQPLDWGTRLRIALDCARALEFLHEKSVPPVIHGDFKSSNVLLGHNYRAKVSDFGLAKVGSNKINGQITARVVGTTGYVAPEYAFKGRMTTKSDVYSYGVVLLELLTGRVPIDVNRPPGEHVLVSWALPRLTNSEKVAEMVDPALQGQYSKKELIQIAAIAAVCVQSEADYRPLMTDVVQSLIPLVKSLTTSCPTTPSKLKHLIATPRS